MDLDQRLIGRLHRFCGHEEQPVTAGNGFLMSGKTSNASYIAGRNEKEFVAALLESISPGDTVYNVGANIGYTALYLSQHFNNKIKVVAFEPAPGTIDILKENISLNQSDIHAVQSVVGDFDGTIPFTYFNPGDCHSLITTSAVGGKVIDVKSTMIDSFEGPAPDWIVMDIEGYGAHAIRGAVNTLKTHKTSVAAEIHSNEELSGIEATLLPLGYRRHKDVRSYGGHHIFWKV